MIAVVNDVEHCVLFGSVEAVYCSVIERELFEHLACGRLIEPAFAEYAVEIIIFACRHKLFKRSAVERYRRSTFRSRNDYITVEYSVRDIKRNSARHCNERIECTVENRELSVVRSHFGCSEVYGTYAVSRDCKRYCRKNARGIVFVVIVKALAVHVEFYSGAGGEHY